MSIKCIILQLELKRYRAPKEYPVLSSIELKPSNLIFKFFYVLNKFIILLYVNKVHTTAT